MNHRAEKVLDISWETILKIALAFFIFYIIYLVRDILVWFLFAIIISLIFDPAINFLQKLKIPRLLASIFIYVSIFGILGLLIYFTVPLFISEIQQFSQLFPQYFEKIAPPLRALGLEAFSSIDSFTQSLSSALQRASSDILNAVTFFFGGIGSTIFILTLAFFLSLEERGVDALIKLLSPKKYENFILSLWEKSQIKVSAWFGSRLLLALFLGVAVFIVLSLFGVKYAVSFALLNAVLDFIPIIGALVAGFITVIFIALDSWSKALFVLIALFFIQQIQGNILSPLLTKKFVGIPAVLVLLSLAIGGKLLGVLGAVLAIPMTAILFEFLKDFLKKKKDKEEKTVIL